MHALISRTLIFSLIVLSSLVPVWSEEKPSVVMSIKIYADGISEVRIEFPYENYEAFLEKMSLMDISPIEAQKIIRGTINDWLEGSKQFSFIPEGDKMIIEFKWVESIRETEDGYYEIKYRDFDYDMKSLSAMLFGNKKCKCLDALKIELPKGSKLKDAVPVYNEEQNGVYIWYNDESRPKPVRFIRYIPKIVYSIVSEEESVKEMIENGKVELLNLREKLDEIKDMGAENEKVNEISQKLGIAEDQIAEAEELLSGGSIRDAFLKAKSAREILSVYYSEMENYFYCLRYRELSEDVKQKMSLVNTLVEEAKKKNHPAILDIIEMLDSAKEDLRKASAFERGEICETAYFYLIGVNHTLSKIEEIVGGKIPLDILSKRTEVREKLTECNNGIYKIKETGDSKELIEELTKYRDSASKYMNESIDLALDGKYTESREKITQAEAEVDKCLRVIKEYEKETGGNFLSPLRIGILLLLSVVVIFIVSLTLKIKMARKRQEDHKSGVTVESGKRNLEEGNEGKRSE